MAKKGLNILLQCHHQLQDTRRWLGNISACLQGAFWHKTKSSSAAGHTRRHLVETHLMDKCLDWQANI